MFGVEVLVWLSDPHSVSSYYQLMKNFVMGGQIGHSALKVTIPSTPAFESLVKKYCLNEEGEELIPHYQTEILVKDKSIDPKTKEVHYHSKKVSAWVIYFSWWPSGLKTELHDLVCENHDLKVEYEKKWLDYLNVSYAKERRGLFSYWVGERLSNFILGAAKEVPLPIDTIIHPHPQADELKKLLAEKEDAYLKVNKALMAFLTKHDKLINELRILKIRKRYASYNYTREWIWMSDSEKEKYQSIKDKLKLEKEHIWKEIALVLEMSEPIAELESKLKKELDEIERRYYSQVATIGCRPTHIARLPIDGVSELRGGLDLEKMLKCMREFAKSKFDFDIAFYNCSTTSHAILLSGITDEVKKEMLSSGLMKVSDLQCDIIESPDHIFSFSAHLQTAFLGYQMSKLSLALESRSDLLSDPTLDSKVLIHRHPVQRAPEQSMDGRKRVVALPIQPRLF